MKKTISEIEVLLSKAAAKYVLADEAAYFAKYEMQDHLKSFPRTDPLAEAVKDIQFWGNSQMSEIQLDVDKPAAFRVNFNGLGPSLKLKYLHDELEVRAKTNGVAFAAISNSSGLHTMSLWVDALAERGLLTLASFNGGPDAVVPFAGTKGILGTNPVAYSFPTGTDSIHADMALSQIPYFQVVNAKKSGEKLPPDTVVDGDGRVTTDAQKAIDDKEVSNILPLGGGYKGYALILLAEVMTGALIGSKLSTEQDPGYDALEHGGFIVAVDIATFNKLDSFISSVDDMASKLKSQKPAAGQAITLPGDNSSKRMKDRVAEGEIEVKSELYEELVDLSR